MKIAIFQRATDREDAISSRLRDYSAAIGEITAFYG
jgi:hypothetical protein